MKYQIISTILLRLTFSRSAVWLWIAKCFLCHFIRIKLKFMLMFEQIEEATTKQNPCVCVFCFLAVWQSQEEKDFLWTLKKLNFDWKMPLFELQIHICYAKNNNNNHGKQLHQRAPANTVAGIPTVLFYFDSEIISCNVIKWYVFMVLSVFFRIHIVYVGTTNQTFGSRAFCETC